MTTATDAEPPIQGAPPRRHQDQRRPLILNCQPSTINRRLSTIAHEC